MADERQPTSDLERKIWALAAGPFFDELMRGPDVAEQYLTHPDPKARLGAVLLLRDYWGPPAGFTKLCERLAVEDSNIGVRCAALTHLGAEHYETHNARMGRLFAGMVQDQGEPRELRYVAYVCLYALDGCHGQEPNSQTFHIPEDVNWSLVERYLSPELKPPAE
jgi:hypothetical protein